MRRYMIPLLSSVVLAAGMEEALAQAQPRDVERIENPVTVFAGLDKITGRIVEFDVSIDEKVQFGALHITPKACLTTPPTEQQETVAFVEVDEVTLQNEVRRIFTGWMFAASPGLNAVEHPIFDVWVTGCKGGEEQPIPQTPAAGQ